MRIDWPAIIRFLGYAMNDRGTDISIERLRNVIEGINIAKNLNLTPEELASMTPDQLQDAAWASFRADMVQKNASLVEAAEATERALKSLEEAEDQASLPASYPRASIKIALQIEAAERYLAAAQETVHDRIEIDPRVAKKTIDKRYLESMERSLRAG